jgi:hypothetical protein
LIGEIEVIINLGVRYNIAPTQIAGPPVTSGHPMTRSRPLARPLRAFGSAKLLSSFSKCLKSRSHGRGIWLRLVEAPKAKAESRMARGKKCWANGNGRICRPGVARLNSDFNLGS